jgi:hypothetical protein
MVCDCTLKAVGYLALAYVFYRLAVALYHILFPYVFATPKNLKSLAGARWAGKYNLIIACIKALF